MEKVQQRQDKLALTIRMPVLVYTIRISLIFLYGLAKTA